MAASVERSKSNEEAIIVELFEKTTADDVFMRRLCDGTGFFDGPRAASILWATIVSNARDDTEPLISSCKAVFTILLRTKLIPHGMNDLPDPQVANVPMESAISWNLSAAEALFDIYKENPVRCPLALGDLGQNLVAALEANTDRIPFVLRLVDLATDQHLNQRHPTTGSTVVERCIKAIWATHGAVDATYPKNENGTSRLAIGKRKLESRVSLFRHLMSESVVRHDGSGLNVIDATIVDKKTSCNRLTPLQFLVQDYGNDLSISEHGNYLYGEMKNLLEMAVNRVLTYRSTFPSMLVDGLGKYVNIADLHALIVDYILPRPVSLRST